LFLEESTMKSALITAASLLFLSACDGGYAKEKKVCEESGGKLLRNQLWNNLCSRLESYKLYARNAAEIATKSIRCQSSFLV